jgi:hypothetical protein
MSTRLTGAQRKSKKVDETPKQVARAELDTEKPEETAEDKRAAGGLELLLSGDIDIDDAFDTIRGDGKKTKRKKKAK